MLLVILAENSCCFSFALFAILLFLMVLHLVQLIIAISGFNIYSLSTRKCNSMKKGVIAHLWCLPKKLLNDPTQDSVASLLGCLGPIISLAIAPGTGNTVSRSYFISGQQRINLFSLYSFKNNLKSNLSRDKTLNSPCSLQYSITDIVVKGAQIGIVR